MDPSLAKPLGLAFAAALSVSATGYAQSESAASFGLKDRIQCQRAIEQVYARHRSEGRDPALAPTVSAEAVRRKAEDAVLKSAALQRLWGVTLTDRQLQAELDRMAARSQAPDVLRELFAALDDDPARAAECLARPLLVDRLIRGYYSHDRRFHGSLKARATREREENGSLSALKSGSGAYSELEWRRGSSRAPGVINLEPEAFEARSREIRRSLGGANGEVDLGRVSPLREDEARFYAASVLALDDQRLRVAIVEWRKRPFDSWWRETRGQLPLQATTTSFAFRLPVPPPSSCRDDSWRPTLQLLDPRYWHTAVWTGSEMIVFGGMSYVGVVYGDGSRYDPATDTWTLLASSGAPARRQSHVAVWTGKEMVVWGGRGDTTGGRYDPVTDTWKTTSTVNAPALRFSASVVWTGTEMLVWGGDGGGFALNSGGRYDPASNTWTPMAQAPLAPRIFHAAAWTGARMVVWGGANNYIGEMYGDGARYDPGTNSWSPVASANAPSARFYHTAVWTGSDVIVWGGLNYPVYDLSGGRYDPVADTWTPTSLVNAPSLRWMHAAVWTGTEMLVEGGTPGAVAGGRYNPATDTWTATSPLNAANNGQGITAVWTGTEMILWGGLDDNSVFHNDGGRYDPAADLWHGTSTMNVPSARGLHDAVWTGSEMIVWGGFSFGLPNTGGRYDPATDSWSPTSTDRAPAGRENVTGVWTGSEAIFWGGWPDTNPGFPGTGGRYSPATDSWSLTTTVNAPTSRYGHSSVWTGSEMIVFGGDGAFDSIAKRYRPATDTWIDATLANAPGQRLHHAAVWTGTEMILWGGYTYDGITPTGGRYRPATDTWIPTNVGSSPPTREWPVGVWTGREMIVWGGYDWFNLQDLGDGARYDPLTDSWAVTTLTGAPAPRVAQGVWTGKQLVLWGGVDDSSGGRYDPLGDSWHPTTLVGAPQVLDGGRWSTVWTGSQMIIWGGEGPTQRGGLYCASGKPNVAPVAAGNSYSMAPGGVLVVGNEAGVLANDSDANGDSLTALLVTSTAHGILQFNANGSFTYSPAPGFTGVDRFSYRANDGLANSNAARVRIAVQ
jgi:N-acetylneuraminic acid mutarotase